MKGATVGISFDLLWLRVLLAWMADRPVGGDPAWQARRDAAQRCVENIRKAKGALDINGEDIHTSAIHSELRADLHAALEKLAEVSPSITPVSLVASLKQ